MCIHTRLPRWRVAATVLVSVIGICFGLIALTTISDVTMRTMMRNTIMTIRNNPFNERIMDRGLTPYKRMCPSVLEQIAEGQWIPRDFSSEELLKVRAMYRQSQPSRGVPIRQLYPNMSTRHRACGATRHQWFRTLCDPFGEMPCCDGEKCVSRDPCTCDTCLDYRGLVYPELATWEPYNTNCGLVGATEEAMCDAINSSHITLYGDSLQLYSYVGLAQLIERNETAPVRNPARAPANCRGFYLMGSYKCMYEFETVNRKVCNGTATISTYYHPLPKDLNKALEIIENLSKMTNSLFVMHCGIWGNYNITKVITEFAAPVARFKHNLEEETKWPRLLWMTTHAAGYIKRPEVNNQGRKFQQIYNTEMTKFWRYHNVTVFNVFNFTKNVYSVDGVHFGSAINKKKGQFLLTYIKELKEQGLWEI